MIASARYELTFGTHRDYLYVQQQMPDINTESLGMGIERNIILHLLTVPMPKDSLYGRHMADATVKKAPDFNHGLIEGERLPKMLSTAEIKKRMINTKKSNLAIPTAVPAMPPNPKTAAMSAMTRKAMAQLNMT